jgi:hypothetical protein
MEDSKEQLGFFQDEWLPQVQRRKMCWYSYTRSRLNEKVNYLAMSNVSGVLLLPVRFCTRTWLMWIEIL